MVGTTRNSEVRPVAREQSDAEIEQFECVVCGAGDHDGDGWIFPTADTEVVGLSENGVERELVDDPRPICSIGCKDEFKEVNDGGW